MENRLSIQMELGMREVRECNAYSRQFGLVLKEPETRELVECRQKVLVDTGRVEFGGGILPKLIHAFCDSPYIDQETYAATLAELQEAFYYFKGEAQERFTDDERIEFIKTRRQGELVSLPPLFLNLDFRSSLKVEDYSGACIYSCRFQR